MRVARSDVCHMLSLITPIGMFRLLAMPAHECRLTYIVSGIGSFAICSIMYRWRLVFFCMLRYCAYSSPAEGL